MENKEEIPTSAEVVTPNKFKQILFKLRLRAFSIFVSLLTIAIAVPFVILVCKYANVIWRLVF